MPVKQIGRDREQPLTRRDSLVFFGGYGGFGGHDAFLRFLLDTGVTGQYQLASVTGQYHKTGR